MIPLYRAILLKAWIYTKKLRYLWPLGLLAAFLGNGGEYQVLFQQISDVAKQQSTLGNWQFSIFRLWNGITLSGNRIFFVIFGLLILLLVLFLFIWLVVSAYNGIIKGIALADKNEPSKFKALFKAGTKKFWPIFILIVVLKILIYAVIALILNPIIILTFAQGNYSLNVFIVLLTFLIFIPLEIIISLVVKFASAYIILEGQNTWTAFKNGWKMFKNNWLVSLEMAFIIFFINLIVSLALVVLTALILSPFFFIGVVYASPSGQLFTSLMAVSITLITLIILFFSALLATFQITSWTLLFLKLQSGQKVYSKIIRLAASLPSKLKKGSA